MSETSDDLVTVQYTATEFEANLIVSMLENADIEAWAFATGSSWIGLLLSPGRRDMPVQVRRADLERARTALAQQISDSVDLDWDEVDVGEREDGVPPSTQAGMPLLVQFGFLIAAILILIMILGGVLIGVSFIRF